MIEKTEKEFNIYRMREMAQLESDFDKMMKELPSKDKEIDHITTVPPTPAQLI